MTILNVKDENTGEFVAVDVDNPSGNLYVRDADTGNFLLLDLSAPTGVVKVIDANTGEFISVDHASPTGTLNVIDPNTGDFLAIDLSSPTGTLYCIDDKTGEFVQLDISTAKFFKSGGFLGMAGGGSVPWYLSGGIDHTKVIAAYQAIGAASKAASLVSLNSNGNDFVENGTVTWDVSGWSGFTAANFFSGIYNWSTGYSYIVRYSGAIQLPDWHRMFYAKDTSTEYLFLAVWGADGNAYMNNNGNNWATPHATSGTYIITPTKAYKSGVDLGAAGASGGSYTGLEWKFGRGYGDTYYYPGKVEAFAIYDGELTAPQVAALHAALEGL